MGKIVRTEAFPITITDGEPSDLPDCWQPQQRTATVIVGYDEDDKPVGSIRVFD